MNTPAAKLEITQTHLVQELKYTSPLIGARIDPTGRFVFAGAQDNSLQRWELATGKATPLLGHKTWVRALAFTSDGKRLFSADWTGKILAWPADSDRPTPSFTIDAHRGWARALALSPDGKTLASCGNDHLVKLWSVADGSPIAQFAGHENHVYNIAFHPAGKRLASCDLKGVVKEWDLQSGKAARDLDASVLYKYDTVFMADIGGARGMAFDAAGKFLGCAGITGVSNAFAGIGKPAVVLFDWASGKRKLLLVAKETFQGTMWGVAFHPEGFIVGAAGGNGGALFFWKPDQDKAFHQLKLPSNARDLSLHPDGRRLAMPFFDGAVRIYEMTAAPPGKANPPAQAAPKKKKKKKK
jgi:WD40 repeat protein